MRLSSPIRSGRGRAAWVVLLALLAVRCGSGSAAPGGDSAAAADADGAAGVDLPVGDVPSFPVAYEGAFTVQDDFSAQTLTVGGEERSVYLYAPASRGAHPPLLIAFHGTSGQPDDWTEENPQYDPNGLEELARDRGFLLAAPRARDWGEGWSDWDNHGGNDRYWETGFDANPARGKDIEANADLVLVQAIIEAAVAAYGVDRARVHVIGFSNGGFFSVHTALLLRDRIASFAAAGSGLVTCDTTGGCLLESSATDCAAILAQAATECPDCDGAEKPVAVPEGGRTVAGILGHNNRDDIVSVAFSCRLAATLTERGHEVQTVIGDAEGHGIPDGFIPAAVDFLLSHPRR